MMSDCSAAGMKASCCLVSWDCRLPACCSLVCACRVPVLSALARLVPPLKPPQGRNSSLNRHQVWCLNMHLDA